MKLYDSFGPNPKVVKMFLAEKGVDLPRQGIDIMKNENREADHLGRNPSGQTPALELDDGSFVSEVTAICEYLEEIFPTPPLIGVTPEARAQTRMWTRKVDLNICEPMAAGFRFGEGVNFFKKRIHVEPDASAGLKRVAQSNLKWLDKQLQGRLWIAGDQLTLADILLFCFLTTFDKMGQPFDTRNQNLAAWFDRVAERSSSSS